MTTYVLVVLFYYQRSGITAEFTTKEKCEIAGQKIVSEVLQGYGPKYYCLEK